uniref:Uncharacterized protein n=1 Tax=Heterorhabditis bacteriophora TaxID=37862 RepID=A0A1I7WGM6_HETBA
MSNILVFLKHRHTYSVIRATSISGPTNVGGTVVVAYDGGKKYKRMQRKGQVQTVQNAEGRDRTTRQNAEKGGYERRIFQLFQFCSSFEKDKYLPLEEQLGEDMGMIQCDYEYDAGEDETCSVIDDMLREKYIYGTNDISGQLINNLRIERLRREFKQSQL